MPRTVPLGLLPAYGCWNLLSSLYTAWNLVFYCQCGAWSPRRLYGVSISLTSTMANRSAAHPSLDDRGSSGSQSCGGWGMPCHDFSPWLPNRAPHTFCISGSHSCCGACNQRFGARNIRRVPLMLADHCALAAMVKVPEATALLEYPLATAMAFKVVVEETVSGPVYSFEAGVGLVPSIV
jgi:hypothetical protein